MSFGFVINEYELMKRVDETGAIQIIRIGPSDGQDAPPLQYIDQDVLPNANYTYAVRAYNDLGPSEWSPNATFATGEGSLPGQPEPPSRGDAYGYTKVTSFYLSWDEPSSPSYHILSMDLRIFGANQTVVDVMNFPGQSNYLFTCQPADACSPNTAYTFQVRAWNALGPGAWSENVTFVTETATVPDKPEPVASRPTSDYFLKRQWLLVYWNPPFDQGLAIRQYELKVVNYNDTNTSLYMSKLRFAMPYVSGCNTSECSIFLTDTVYNLKLPYAAAVRYFSVRAENVAGWSDWSDPTPHSTAEPEPPRMMGAPTLPSSGGVDCNSITVLWEEASSSGQLISSYELRTNLDNSTIRVVPSTLRSQVYTALSPGATYAFDIRAINTFRGAGEAETPCIALRPNQPMSPCPVAPH